MTAIADRSETPVAVEQLDACPWCGGKRFRKKWTSHDRLHLVSRQSFGYQQCRTCKILFQSPRPPESEIHQFYPAAYGPYKPVAGAVPLPAAGGKRLLTWPVRKAFRALVRLTDRFFPSSFAQQYFAFYKPEGPGQALLDFGCGSATFLNKARELGWDTTGMDFSAQAVEQARASGHRALLCADDAWEQLADASFQFVRLSHVLEHLYHPHAALRQLAGKTAPGGMLHLALPNPQSLSCRVFGARWFSLDCPRHIMLYTASFLRRELPEYGFEVVRVLHEPVTKDFARSWAYRQYDRKRISHDQIEGYVHHRLLNDAVTVPLRVLAGAGVGERIHVFARKT